ncbi:MAG: hypothetical protein JSU01_13440 [Bacteroidetes bacterium]|nr:hypothetical protein [Bacteroidota bacterium]
MNKFRYTKQATMAYMKKLFTCAIFLLLFAGAAYPQLMYQPYSYQFNQKLN